MSIATSVTLSRGVTVGLLLLATLLSGLWVSYLGRPLNGLVFGIHKLIAVATIFVIGRHLYHLQQALGTRTFVELALIVATGLLFLALLVSGSVLSFEKPARPIFLRIHQIVPLLAVAASASSLYLLASSKA